MFKHVSLSKAVLTVIVLCHFFLVSILPVTVWTEIYASKIKNLSLKEGLKFRFHTLTCDKTYKNVKLIKLYMVMYIIFIQNVDILKGWGDDVVKVWCECDMARQGWSVGVMCGWLCVGRLYFWGAEVVRKL